MKDDQDERTEAILGDEEELEFDEAKERFYEHLKKHLQLPCEVTGIEDFRWEEFYVLGSGNRREYEQLKKTQPSYRDRYDLLEIDKDGISEWMLWGNEDIGALVRRRSDGQEFCLGLSELKATDRKSQNYQLLDDFSVWLANCR